MSLFQYDYDQSWAAFFLNADLTIYGRYGTRSHPTKSDDDVSLASFGKALLGALDLHAQYPANKAALADKRGLAAEVKSPEEFPALKARGAKPDYAGQVAQSCIHCHMVGEAQRVFYRANNRPIPEKVLYPYPNPKILGLILDPTEKAKVKSVVPGSPAERDGFQAGDELVTLSRQPLLSIADVQWVLHNAEDSRATFVLLAEIRRDGLTMAKTLTMPAGWRQKDDLSWRASSWDLRRMALGGMRLEDLPPSERASNMIPPGTTALRAKQVGQVGPHATAKQAGFRQSDVVISVSGRSDFLTESDLMATLITEKRPGDKVAVTVLRGREKLELMLLIQ